MKQSVLNIKVSGFENCHATSPKDLNLLTWLTSEKYADKIKSLRSIQDEGLQDIMKKSLPAITPCGTFSYRDGGHLIEHSGLLVFDIDKKDNKNISFAGLREQISHIKNVAYCGLSCRGLGLWGLVPIPQSNPDEHKQRFASLSKDFKGFGINLDPSGSEVNRLRICSFDPEAYFNHNAKLYTKIEKLKRKTSERPVYTDTREQVEAVIKKIKESKIDITGDYKEGWLKIASALANEFGKAGRGYFHEVSQYHAKYNEGKTDLMFNNVLKHEYNKVKIGSFFKIASDYGIRLKTEPATIQPRTSQDQVKTLPEVEKVVKFKPGPWSDEIAELESFFNSVKLTANPVPLDRCSRVTDINLFIKSHLSIVKAQNGNDRYLPYLDRLNELKNNMN